MQQETAQHIASVADKITVGGVVASAIGGLSATEIAAFGGLFVAIISAFISRLIDWLNHRELKRHNRALEAWRDSPK
jgi:hypothetical protein